MTRTRLPLALTAWAALAVALIIWALTMAPPAQSVTPPFRGTLVGTVGPGFNITLTKGGTKVTSLRAGRYTVIVRDRSNAHNFRLRAPAGPLRFNRATTVPQVVNRTWSVTMTKLGTWTYVCDPHPELMTRTFKVIR